MKTPSRAFSLIELLSVVAIIGILTTLAYAGVGAAISKGNATRCLANMRQVGTAIQMFAGENGGRLPSVDHAAQISWTNTLAAFLGTNFIGRCPALRVATWSKRTICTLGSGASRLCEKSCSTS